ncbi:MAG TPA: PH domain-containing protein [Usitatibacter sp.]|nr:PH domain-containing protein [Usitatibacter sp.]
MSYIDESLVQGESIVHRAHVSWWSQFGYIVLGILTFWFLLGFVFLAIAWVKVHSTEIAITNRRIIAKFGFIRRRTIEINIAQVEALRVEQGFWGRLLNFGTIIVSGTGSSLEPAPDIADPLVFRRKFMEATNRPVTSPRA